MKKTLKCNKLIELENYFRNKSYEELADAMQAVVGCIEDGTLIISIATKKDEYIEYFKIIKLYDKELIHDSMHIGLYPHLLIDEVNELINTNNRRN